MEVIFLGIIQGLTEFLPISSSGHLVILEHLLGVKKTVEITVALHFGTLMATIVFFLKPLLDIIRGIFQLKSESIKMALYIIIGNLPVIFFYLIFKEVVEESFKSPRIVFLFLGLTGMILLITKIARKREVKITFKKVLIVGMGQMFALFPGLSRSGLTIAFGIFAGLSPKDAFEFSFLLSLPALLGANLLEMKKVVFFDELIFGIGLSFLVGLLALKLLRITVQKHFFIFGFYCLIVSIIFLLLGY